MRLTRREFTKLFALGLGIGTAAGWPALAREAGAAPGRAVGFVALDPDLPLHPLLQYGAQAEPGKVVRVIVQTARPDHDGRGLARGAGATYLEGFPFIKAHHLEVPQRALLGLARNPHVLYISPDGPVQRHAVSTAALRTTYPLTVNANQVWNDAKLPATGKGIVVAVLDTGVSPHPDLAGDVIPVAVNPVARTSDDPHGHGTHIAGIITGRAANGAYVGVAPDSTVLGVKIGDDRGQATSTDLLRGLQWCYNNRAGYGGSAPLRVVNLSITAGIAESYRTSPICAAAEQLWFAGVAVVVAAGNRGTAADATWYAPANDPYVITVGATDEGGSGGIGDDSLTRFSSRGATQDGFYKPDLVAPGRQIVSALASPGCTLATAYPNRITDTAYIRQSGTSMSAPVVAGVLALLLERFPALTPNQLKGLLRATVKAYGELQSISATGDGEVDAARALQVAARGGVVAANAGLTPNAGINAATGTVQWGAAYWDAAYWDAAYWDAAYWDSAAYD